MATVAVAGCGMSGAPSHACWAGAHKDCRLAACHFSSAATVSVPSGNAVQAMANVMPPVRQLAMCSCESSLPNGTARSAVSGLHGIKACSVPSARRTSRQLKVGWQADSSATKAAPRMTIVMRAKDPFGKDERKEAISGWAD